MQTWMTPLKFWASLVTMTAESDKISQDRIGIMVFAPEGSRYHDPQFLLNPQLLPRNFGYNTITIAWRQIRHLSGLQCILILQKVTLLIWALSCGYETSFNSQTVWTNPELIGHTRKVKSFWKPTTARMQPVGKIKCLVLRRETYFLTNWFLVDTDWLGREASV